MGQTWASFAKISAASTLYLSAIGLSLPVVLSWKKYIIFLCIIYGNTFQANQEELGPLIQNQQCTQGDEQSAYHDWALETPLLYKYSHSKILKEHGWYRSW